MRPAEYGDDEIIKAGEELQAEGRNVTGFALRQKVGGGNPTRLKAIWEAHVAGSSPAEVEPVAELPNEVAEALKELVSGLSDQITRLAVDLNDKAVKASERRVSEVVKAASLERETSEREMADATATVNDLEEKLDEAQQEIGDLTATVEDTRAALSECRTSLARAEEKQAQAEKTVADQQVQIGELEARIKAMGAESAQKDQKIAILEHDAEQHAVQVKALESKLEELQQQLAAQAEAHAAEVKRMISTSIKQETTVNALTARLEAADRELKKSEARADRLEQRLIALAENKPEPQGKPDKPARAPRKTPARKAPAKKAAAQDGKQGEKDDKQEAKAQLDAWSAESAKQNETPDAPAAGENEQEAES